MCRKKCQTNWSYHDDKKKLVLHEDKTNLVALFCDKIQKNVFRDELAKILFFEI